MDFQNVNSLNVRLNMLSGNLLPMTSDGSLFPIAWRMYSVIIWLIEMIQICGMILAMILIPKEILQDGGTMGFLIGIEVLVLMTRMNARRDLINRLIEKLNGMLRSDDETMKSIVHSTLRPIKIPLEFYWIVGTSSLMVWCCMPLALIFKRTHFFYKDFRVPIILTKQPFSIEIFVVGSFLVSITCVYLFIKKVALDVYMINFMLLMTVQYRYIAIKLATIFRDRDAQDDADDELRKEYYFKAKSYAERKIKIVCQHHNSVMHITPMLRELLSSNMSLMYLSNVFRFCFLGIMLISAILSSNFLDIFMISMYISGGLVQLYILCLSVQQLLNASMEITNAAFHEKWYHYKPSLKRIFMLMIMSNNLVCKLSKFEKFNLSLPSFMTILNQSYSIALLFLKMK